MKQRTIILLIMGVLLLFYLFPSPHKITVYNELGERVEVNYKGSWWQGGYGSQFTVWVTPGDHQLQLFKDGFETQTITISNWNNFIKSKSLTFTIKAIQLSESNWKFLDPTGTIQLHPRITIKGFDVNKQEVDTVIFPGDSFTAGYYELYIDDVHFTKHATLSADRLVINNEVQQQITLEPNNKFTTISHEEAQHVFNFMIDYVDLVNKKIITDELLPKQFYLGEQQRAISSADMIFLMCLSQVYEQQNKENVVPIFFVPKNKLFIHDETMYPQECYKYGLAGYTPNKIKPFAYEFDLTNLKLNQRSLKEPLLLTFDIESGRYVHMNKGPRAINPCQDEITQKGLTTQQKLNCNDPNQVAWFSPLKGNNTGSIPYPWITGVDGTNEILSYSTKYGIPTTHYLLTRELDVLGEYDPTITKTYNKLTGSLIEIGSHTNTHNKLGTHPKESDIKELKTSKEYLEERFNTKINTVRGPYLSKISNNIQSHQKALQELGYKYHSTDNGDVESIPVTNYPINVYYTADVKVTDLPYRAQTQGQIVTLDHPWNMHYSEYQGANDVYLIRNNTRAELSKAFIFQAVANGYEPMTLARLHELRNK